ncbi:mitochondrial 54S ribosomal protein YmL47 [Sugiyamaella lignohabitans]|uniref:Mitochondrial 54S ribosomal protein YmL47 n=1 Tax=Sugiyamaella lignohabitans TaxID=796027 RepID=A0A167F198_9ASCO|nr:mitochondrial 54S ribosomal protein YmL47 [Sugiyamaella lignohabitans]ANB14698.1 mitochondrial 54S ribosomal protein YmL47 [Sugiyamaella lignohabitans]
MFSRVFSALKPSALLAPSSLLTSVGASRTTALTSRFGGSTFQQIRLKHQYEPRVRIKRKAQKGRVPVRTGGSIKGSTLQFGKFGLRLKSEGVRLKAVQLKEADNAIMRALRPLKGKLFRRLTTNIPVCVKGNETRMGKGKGGFEFWACRVPTGKILFEIDGANVHESVARDAFRIAGDKLPGTYEFVNLETAPKAGFQPVNVDGSPVNFYEEAKANPTKQYANVLQGQDPELRKYLRR